MRPGTPTAPSKRRRHDDGIGAIAASTRPSKDGGGFEMIDYFFLVPIAIGMGLAGLASFMWTLRSGQYDDLEGAANRILFEADDGPLLDGRHPAAAHQPGNPPTRR
jgi:cbb3-type cytochrome oxidase maturation protein